MKSNKSILRDVSSGKFLKLSKIHGNKIVKNPITGQKIRMGEWRKRNKRQNQALIKVLKCADEEVKSLSENFPV